MLPETILQRAIVNGFQAIRKDPRILNVLFKNLPARQQEDVKSLILEKSIDFSINYPRTDIKVPAIVMLLKTENESQQFLGDVMGVPNFYDTPDQDMTEDTLGATGADISKPDGLPPVVLANLHVASMLSSSAITFIPVDQAKINDIFSTQSEWALLNLHVVAGAGVGQVKLIEIISNNQLDIVDTFELNLDDTSIVTIRYVQNPAGPGAYGEPTKAYQKRPSLVQIGANYDEQYQLEILAGNQEEVIYLYAVLKAVLFMQRTFLETQGIMALKLSGTDLAPRSELLPDELYTRSLTLQFTYPFSLMIEQEVMSAIEITLFSVDPNSTIPGSVVITEEIPLE